MQCKTQLERRYKDDRFLTLHGSFPNTAAMAFLWCMSAVRPSRHLQLLMMETVPTSETEMSMFVGCGARTQLCHRSSRHQQDTRLSCRVHEFLDAYQGRFANAARNPAAVHGLHDSSPGTPPGQPARACQAPAEWVRPSCSLAVQGAATPPPSPGGQCLALCGASPVASLDPAHSPCCVASSAVGLLAMFSQRVLRLAA